MAIAAAPTSARAVLVSLARPVAQNRMGAFGIRAAPRLALEVIITVLLLHLVALQADVGVAATVVTAAVR